MYKYSDNISQYLHVHSFIIDTFSIGVYLCAVRVKLHTANTL